MKILNLLTEKQGIIRLCGLKGDALNSWLEVRFTLAISFFCLILCIGPASGLLFLWSPAPRLWPGRVGTGHRKRSRAERGVSAIDPFASLPSCLSSRPPLHHPSLVSACPFLPWVTHNLYWSLIVCSFLSIHLI